MNTPQAAPSHADELFRVALEATSTGMLMTDGAGRITLANAQIETLFQYDRAELAGMALEDLMPSRYRQRHAQLREEFFARPRVRLIGQGRELFGLRKDGSEIPLEIALTPVTTSEGEFVLASILDITERHQAVENLRQRTEALSASLRERDLLLQEVHHRVKNNLQLISSLINMQARKLSAAAPREALAECKRRVEAIGLIHETLYQSHNYAEVPFSDYVRNLAANLMHGVEGPGRLELICRCDPVTLPVAKAISCGLLLNELLTETLREAQSRASAGTLRIELRRLSDGRAQLTMNIPDDSPAQSGEGHSSTGQSSLGHQLVTMLTEQLHGTLQEGSRDTPTTVTFPIED